MSNNDLSEPNAKILGQILAAQNILFVLPSDKQIVDFLSKSLSVVPGVNSCQVCLNQTSSHKETKLQETCNECENIRFKTEGSIPKNLNCNFAGLTDYYVHPIETVSHRFGFLIFKLDKLESFNLYKPFICNLGNLIALSLENRLQKLDLQKAQGVLEKSVEERTLELFNTNKRLENELIERDKTERRLASQNALLSSLINSSRNLIIFSLDKNYCYTAFNEKHSEEMQKIWNVDIKIGMNLLDCMEISELKALAKKSIDRAMSGETFSEIQHQPEAQIYYEFIWNPVIQNEEIVGVTAFIQDITERKKSEIITRESEHLFRALVENSPDFIARYNLDYQRTYVNPAIMKLFGNSETDVLKKTPEDKTPLYTPKVYIEQIQKVIDTSNEFSKEIPFRTEQGEMHWGHIRFVPEFDQKGKVISVLAIGRDIHEIKESEQRFKMLAENFPDFVFRFDRNCRYLYINSAVENAFGLHFNHFLGKTITELPLNRKSELNESIIAIIKNTFNEGPIKNSETLLDTQIGVRLFELRTVQEKDAAGNVVSVLCIARDITEQNLKEKEHESYLKFLENLDTLNKVIRETNNLDQMMNNTMRTILSIYDCDRAWLFYPCDPNSPTFRVPMEVTKPEYPGAKALNIDLPLPKDMAQNLQEALESENPVTYRFETEKPINKISAEHFGVKSMMMIALYPKIGKPWAFGIHQCSTARIWTSEEIKLFKEISRRISDGLSNILVLRDLQKSEERFRTLVTQAADAFFLLGSDGEIIDANQKACNSLGYSRNELIKMNIADIDIEVISHKHKERFWDNINRNKSATFEGKLRRKNGTIYPVEVSLGELEIGDEKLMLGLARDITERKKAEEKILRSEQRLRLHAELSPLGFLEWDENFCATEWNAACERIFGYTREEAIGRHAKDLILPPDVQGLVDEIFHNLLNLSGGQHSINENITKDGSIITCEWFNTTLVNNEGKAIGVASICNDITESKQIEKELREQMDEINRFNKLMVGREEKMIELKKEVNIMLEKGGQKKKYNIG